MGRLRPREGDSLKNQHKQAELPVYLFKQGNNFEAYRFFGAHFEEQGGERAWCSAPGPPMPGL